MNYHYELPSFGVAKSLVAPIERLSGQKISEILSSVTREQITGYFRLRHNRQDAIWEEIYKQKPELRGQPIEYALDNTSISTYSNTLSEAQFGHAKRDPDLKQINYTVICDQRSGDIVFSHMFDGAVNDVSSLSNILFSMREAGFDLAKNILVTDRGYSSLENVQRMINLNIRYLQGVRYIEDSLKQRFAKHRDSLVRTLSTVARKRHLPSRLPSPGRKTQRQVD